LRKRKSHLKMLTLTWKSNPRYTKFCDCIYDQCHHSDEWNRSQEDDCPLDEKRYRGDKEKNPQVWDRVVVKLPRELRDDSIGVVHFEFNVTEALNPFGEEPKWDSRVTWQLEEDETMSGKMEKTVPFRIGKTSDDTDIEGLMPHLDNLMRTLPWFRMTNAPIIPADRLKAMKELSTEWKAWKATKGKFNKDMSDEAWAIVFAKEEKKLKAIWRPHIECVEYPEKTANEHIGFVLDVLCHLIKRYYYPLSIDSSKPNPHVERRKKK